MENRIIGYQLPADEQRRRSAAGDGFSPLANPALARGRQMLETSLINHPALGIGAALLLGLAVGWFIKRR